MKHFIDSKADLNRRSNVKKHRCSGLQAIRDRNCAQTGPSGRMGGDPANNSGPIPSGSVFWLPTTGAHPFAQGPR